MRALLFGCLIAAAGCGGGDKADPATPSNDIGASAVADWDGQVPLGDDEQLMPEMPAMDLLERQEAGQLLAG